MKKAIYELSIQERLFLIFEERMSLLCSVVPSDHSKSIVSDEWFDYVDSLSPRVEAIRPSLVFKKHHVTVCKKGNIPVLSLLMERVNRAAFDMVVIEDPGQGAWHVPMWGPNLLLVDRDFALTVLALGELP